MVPSRLQRARGGGADVVGFTDRGGLRAGRGELHALRVVGELDEVELLQVLDRVKQRCQAGARAGEQVGDRERPALG